MIKTFNFYDYEFNDSLTSLLNYLKEKGINYRENKAYIYFEFECIDCKSPIEARVYYKKDEIINIVLFCYPISFNHRKNIESELISRYEMKENHIVNGYKLFFTGIYNIIYECPENIKITIEFSAPDITNKKRSENVRVSHDVPFIIGGAILSTLFITLYFCFKELVWLHVIDLIIGLIYAIFEFYFMYIQQSFMSKTAKKITMIVIPLIFILITSISMFFVAVEITEGDIKGFNWIDFVMVVLCMLPSFNILILIMAALNYA